MFKVGDRVICIDNYVNIDLFTRTNLQQNEYYTVIGTEYNKLNLINSDSQIVYREFRDGSRLERWAPHRFKLVKELKGIASCRWF